MRAKQKWLALIVVAVGLVPAAIMGVWAYIRATAIPLHPNLSTPSDLVRFVIAINSGKLLQPATVQLLQTSQRLASGQETGYGLGWDLETVALAGEQTRVVGHDGASLGGMVASFMMFPEHGIVVSVMSNISYADTFSPAVSIAQAFAEQARRPARK